MVIKMIENKKEKTYFYVQEIDSPQSELMVIFLQPFNDGRQPIMQWYWVNRPSRLGAEFSQDDWMAHCQQTGVLADGVDPAASANPSGAALNGLLPTIPVILDKEGHHRHKAK